MSVSCFNKRKEAVELINKIHKNINVEDILVLQKYKIELEDLMKFIEDNLKDSDQNSSSKSSLQNDDSVIDI